MRESRVSQFGLKAARRDHAIHVLRACGIPTDSSFFALSQSTVSALLEHADRDRYRAPKNANGSRGRYYFAKLQRESAYVD